VCVCVCFIPGDAFSVALKYEAEGVQSSVVVVVVVVVALCVFLYVFSGCEVSITKLNNT
jgi:hypothetical protein